MCSADLNYDFGLAQKQAFLGFEKFNLFLISKKKLSLISDYSKNS